MGALDQPSTTTSASEEGLNRARAASVNIFVESGSGWARKMFGPETHSATGFFVEAGVLGPCEIVTMNHALPQDTTAIRVRTADGARFDATIDGRDERNDIAFLKVNAVTDPERTCRSLQLTAMPPKRGETLQAVTLRANDSRPAVLQGPYLYDAPRNQNPGLPSLPGEDMHRSFRLFRMSAVYGDSGAAIVGPGAASYGMLAAIGANVIGAVPAEVIQTALARLQSQRVSR